MLLKRERMAALLGELAKQARVYVPVKEQAKEQAKEQGKAATRFALYQQVETPAFEAINTMMPPKDLLFPQTQKMYRYGFDAEGNAFIDAIHDADEVVIFGLRSCDAASIECMDDVFLTKGYSDELYGARRELLTTVAIGCAETAETCFCDSMGLDPNTASTADIQLNMTADGDSYVVVAQTEKGVAAIKAWAAFTEEGDAETVEASCTLKVNNVGIKEKLDHLFDHPLWDEVAKKCLTCGTCTFVCPTCHCFDINQENRMREGERFRCWDSCMFTAYTEMAGHHNPRADKVSRVRQRFMHKLCFFEDRYGKSLCVGCGRCVEKCPVALDITCLIDEIGALSWEDVTGSGEGAVDVAIGGAVAAAAPVTAAAPGTAAAKGAVDVAG
jgi:ferredoxin